MSIVSASVLLFLVMDPFGNAPFFLSVLSSVPVEKHKKIIIRELLIALLVLNAFLLMGPHILKVLQVSEAALRIAGGIILFLIAIKMIFGAPEEMLRGTPGGEPLIVPLAIPSIAGPSAVATILILVGQEPAYRPEWALALFMAWVSTTVILLLSAKLHLLLRERGLNALQRLMGLILTTISIEMILQVVRLALDYRVCV